MILKAQMQTVVDKTVISDLHWYASDQYGLLITVSGDGCVGGDFSQTIQSDCSGVTQSTNHSPLVTCAITPLCFRTSFIHHEWWTKNITNRTVYNLTKQTQHT